MNNATILYVILTVTPVSFVILFGFEYQIFADDLCNFLEKQYQALWKEENNRKIRPLLVYGSRFYLKSGIFMQFKTLRYIEEKLPNDLIVLTKIKKMRRTLYFGLSILFIYFVTVIIFGIVAYT